MLVDYKGHDRECEIRRRGGEHCWCWHRESERCRKLLRKNLDAKLDFPLIPDWASR